MFPNHFFFFFGADMPIVQGQLAFRIIFQVKREVHFSALWKNWLVLSIIAVKMLVYQRTLVTRQVICGFWILYVDLLNIHQAEFTITYYSLNLTVITLR
jgi:hypothetical protein